MRHSCARATRSLFVRIATLCQPVPSRMFAKTTRVCTRVPAPPHRGGSGGNPALTALREESPVVPSAVPVKRKWQSAFAAIAWGASTLAFVIAGACLSYATVLEVDRLTRLTTPTPPEVAHDVIVRNVKDEAGHRASFRVLLFTDEFRW